MIQYVLAILYNEFVCLSQCGGLVASWRGFGTRCGDCPVPEGMPEGTGWETPHNRKDAMLKLENAPRGKVPLPAQLPPDGRWEFVLPGTFSWENLPLVFSTSLWPVGLFESERFLGGKVPLPGLPEGEALCHWPLFQADSHTVRVFTQMTRHKYCEAMPGMGWTVFLMLSIGCHVKLDACASKFWASIHRACASGIMFSGVRSMMGCCCCCWWVFWGLCPHQRPRFEDRFPWQFQKVFQKIGVVDCGRSPSNSSSILSLYWQVQRQ